MLKFFLRALLVLAAVASVASMPDVWAEGDAKAGADVYKLNCAACHGANLAGGIAPALKDNTLVSGEESAVIEVVSTGRTDKGMPAWKDQLTEQQIKDVVALLKNPATMPTESAAVADTSFEPDVSTEGINPDMKRSFIFVYLWTLISMVVLLVWIKQRAA